MTTINAVMARDLQNAGSGRRAMNAPCHASTRRSAYRIRSPTRRKAAVQFLGSALFVDRAHGARLAKRVLGEMPMPKVTHARFGEKNP